MRKRVLVVEDDYIIQLFIEDVLHKLDCEVLGKVTTGEDAIASVQTNLPDIILMDVNIDGEMDGIEAAERILSLYDIPIIFVSANSDLHTINKIESISSVGFIRKPIDEFKLKAAFEKACVIIDRK